MSNDNLHLWDQLRTVPKEHLKAFDEGRFKGTAIKPQWQMQRMTEVFGPIGEGWGMGEPSFQTVTLPSDEVMVYCTVSIWHGVPERSAVGVGGDKVFSVNKNGVWFADDDAFKKAFTDALANALKFLGMASDIHMGLFDGNKYVDEPGQSAAPKVRNPETGRMVNPGSSNQLKKNGMWQNLQGSLALCKTGDDLDAALADWESIARDGRWSQSWVDEMREAFDKRFEEIELGAQSKPKGEK